MELGIGTLAAKSTKAYPATPSVTLKIGAGSTLKQGR